MADEQTYTAEQVAVAARELREAAGADEQRVTGPEAVTMLAPEIRLLRERGFTDQQISDLLIGFDICVSADVVKHHTSARRLT